MEDLLTPQICMDIDDTPIDVGKDSSDEETASTHSSQDDDDGKVQQLLELEFKHPAQVPENLADFEIEAKKNVFAAGELSVEYHRLHCTACNIHLGSAPINYFNRYIHPLLKVLVCKSCYEFYCSGEFDKDEDGSEMYCRWCGQGGKVMCCAQCAYVFCQKCVRQNLGKKTLEMIKDSDDWMCFGCNPSQLINLKIVCSSLYDFTQEEIRLAKALSSVERLKVDHSMCCGRTRSSKRKRDEDESYNPYVEDNRGGKRSKTPKAPEKVVCAPDLSTLITDNNKANSPKINKENKSQPTTTNTAKKQFVQPLPNRSFYICGTAANVCKPNNTNVIRIQAPAVKVVAATPTSVPLISSIPVQLIPGTKHEWFEKAATVVSTITGNLSITLDTLTNEVKGSKTVENLAHVHNKLQELLSTSINSLIQVRKSLRNQFLEDLNHLKFTAQNAPRIQVSQATQKVANNDDDDDVVIVNSNLTPKDVKQPKKDKENNGRPYLKVRTVSQLLKVPAECITIPDDPPNDTEMTIKEKETPAIGEKIRGNKSSGALDKEKNQDIQKLNDTKVKDDVQNKTIEINDDKEKSRKENQEIVKLNDGKEKENSETEKKINENDKKDSAKNVENNDINKMLSGEVLLPSSSEQSENDNEEWINEDFEDHLACAIVPNKTEINKSVQIDDDDNEDIQNCDNSQNKNDSGNIISNKDEDTKKEENVNKDETIDEEENINKDENVNKDENINKTPNIDEDEEINKDQGINEVEDINEIEKMNDNDKTEENEKLNDEEEKKIESNETVESESVEKSDEITDLDSKSDVKEIEKDLRTDNESKEFISGSDKKVDETE